MRNQIIRSLLKPFALISIIALVLTGCASRNMEVPFNSGRTDSNLVQAKLREVILARYQESEKAPETIKAKTISKDDVDYVEAQETPELLAWRKDINKTWGQIDDDKIYMICEFMYQGLYDENATFGSYLSATRKQLVADGVSIHSIENIRMREDNRKTIQFPTEKQNSVLFLCSAQIVFKLPNGNFSSPQDSKIYLLYYLYQGKNQFTISFSTSS